MQKLTKTALNKVASGEVNTMLKVAGKSKIEFSPKGATKILEEFTDAKHELYDSPRNFFKVMREHFGVDWRAKIAE